MQRRRVVRADNTRIHYQTELMIIKLKTLSMDKIKRHKKEHEVEGAANELRSNLAKIENQNHGGKLDFLKAKIMFVLLEHNHEKKNKLSEVDISNLKTAYHIFKKVHSYKLECKALINLAQIYENNPQESLSHAKLALSVAKNNSIKDLEKPIKHLIMAANTSIRRQFQNKFYFLSCYPLRDQPEPFCNGVNFAKNLRDEIIPILQRIDKNILVHFDTFTSFMLQELLKENVGCKLLVLDFLYTPENDLVLEAPNLTSEELPFETIRAFLDLDEEKKKIHVDILFVISDEKRDIITQFADACGIPLTIYFDFKRKPANNYDVMVQYLRREYMYTFLKIFTARLVSGTTTAKNAINVANYETLERILFDAKKKMTLYQVNESKSMMFKTHKEVWTLEILEEVLKDSVQVHQRTSTVDISCDLSRGMFY